MQEASVIAPFALVPGAPAAGALLILTFFRRDAAAPRIALGACGVSAAALVAAAAFGADRIALFAGGVTLTIAALVATFAARAMHGGTTPYRRFFATLLFAAAGSLGVAIASDLRWLAAAWIATGIATSALLAVGPGAPARRWALRHARVELAASVAWIAILGVAGGTYRTFDLHALGAAVAPGPAATALALAIVFAGAARSALVPLHAWLPNSMEAPTPVSAFMHAGLVNGAGVLFAKCAFVLAAAPDVLVAAGALGGATALYGTWMGAVRPEAKRRLGWSTVAQMGWMVVQCGSGAFAAALIHLVAHGGYKATRFLGVAGTVVAQRRERERAAPAASHRHPLVPALFALVIPSAGVGFVAWATHGALAALPASSAVVAMAWLTGVVAARAVADTALDATSRGVAAVAIVAATAGYLLVVVALDRWLGAALPAVSVPVLPTLVTAVALAAGCVRACGVSVATLRAVRPLRDRLYVYALVEGRFVSGAAR